MHSSDLHAIGRIFLPKKCVFAWLSISDEHANTHFFGRKIRPIAFKSEECTDAPFLVEYFEQINFPIFTGATSYTIESGEFIILIFGQGLWFGNMMEKNLINPNQCLSFGITICDDPTNQHRPLVIEADFNTHIPMSTVVSTCKFITRCPTDD